MTIEQPNKNLAKNDKHSPQNKIPAFKLEQPKP
jgi:hypothetical protein